ncbi:MAG: FkbM family methyltransferase [Candidatus Magasanikbacteria bacterium]|jgi:FkbM family methyltransferase
MLSEYFLRVKLQFRKPINYIYSFSFFKQFIGPNKLFFDIGANVGNRTRVFNRLGVKVVALEPQSNCADKLAKEFVNKNVVIVRKGVGRGMGEMRMSVCTNVSSISTFSEDWKTGRFKNFKFDKEIVVPMTTLDKLIAEYGSPDFCKIDVEGYEFEVFAGLTKKIDCLNFEFTSEFFKNTIKCLERLIVIGFKEFNFTLGEEPFFILQSWVNKDMLHAIIEEKIKNNTDLWGDIYAR